MATNRPGKEHLLERNMKSLGETRAEMCPSFSEVLRVKLPWRQDRQGRKWKHCIGNYFVCLECCSNQAQRNGNVASEYEAKRDFLSLMRDTEAYFLVYKNKK